MSYSRRRSRKNSSRRAWMIVGICILCLIAYALIRGVYSWITEASQRADIVTVKITDTGFEPRSVALSANQRLHIVNASSHAVVLCMGNNQVCSSSANAPSGAQATPTATTTPADGAMPGDGLTIPPDDSYDLSFKNGNYNFTLGSSTGVSQVDSDDLQVTMQGGNNNSVGSDDENNGVSVSSSSNNDDEENSGSNSGSSSGGSDDDSGGSSGGSSGGDDGGGGSSGGGGDE